jgi:hypothetical protein
MMDNDLRYIDGSKYYVFGIKKSLCDGYVIENDETPEFYEKYYKCIKIGSDVIKNEDLVFMGEFTTDEQIYFSVKPHLTRMEKDKKYFKNKIKSLLILKYKNIDKVLGKLISSEDSYVELTPGWLLFYKRQICVIEKLFDSLCKETSDEIRRMWSSMNKEYFQVDGVLG